MRRTLFIALAGIGFFASAHAAEFLPNTKVTDLAARFNHQFHNEHVFKKNNIECSRCHNFTLEKSTGKVIPNTNFEQSIFRMPLKQVCHQCHRSAEAKWESAPKACYTCHRSMENLKSIKPEDHSNISWKSSHGTEARINGDKCLNCHMTAQCVKCHSQRNDIDLRNHTRNFRFMHSVQARLQPQRCDACHTKSFCVNCHLGKNPR